MTDKMIQVGLAVAGICIGLLIYSSISQFFNMLLATECTVHWVDRTEPNKELTVWSTRRVKGPCPVGDMVEAVKGGGQ